MNEKEIRIIETYVLKPSHSVFWVGGVNGFQEITHVGERGKLKLGFFNSCDGECIELWNTSSEDILVFEKVDWRT